ncbi:FxsA cytoplasmic membrane protein [Streptantibioticus cattleyicolor NRRL 8057 = DSM 46488]|uniref:FxsA cytoplasmic membrane protein n=1 Tax=Streptantibioticus cattleyicolor (strain ATCC 35852 / DSM 46488 / JCM 4925 / NBRC 14057 / NRRL 8057) TaxID=1003195 RepID=G8WVK9_STREN|nr:FxsA cytoplasmic membrane protein [Streptantibioticus cattleyicolor NRRL 8057 = DSM 46488]
MVAAWVVLEIWLLTLVADAAGGVTVLLLLLAGFVLGAAAVKAAGRRAWRELTESVRAGRTPGEEGTGTAPGGGHAGLAMLGGLLLMVPGIVSDAAGLLCLFPPTRRLIGRAAGRVVRRRTWAPGSFGDAYQRIRVHRPDGKVVQGEVVRDDEPAGRHDGDRHGATRRPLGP